VALTLFDARDPGALERAVAAHPPTLVWLESPVNPTWDVIDIAAAAEVTHAAGGILAVDSTVAPPVTTRPLELGADIVVHSATKYLNGHSDVLGGVLVTARVTDRWEEVRRVRKLTGGIMAPFEAWLLVRGLRTLAIRFDRCSANALRIARHLEGHAGVERVLYPGLESHPGHEVARRQMTRGFGGMLSLLVRGDGADARGLATRLKLFTPATSLGGVESLVEHRRTVEGPDSLVPENLLRFSIGIEDPEDLIADLDAALGAV
jgi:cystathionine gamma-synthase